MQSVAIRAIRDAVLTASDVSSILNLICPRCGGPLGEPSREFQCQGLCRKDWRSDWEDSGLNRKKKTTTRRTSGRRMPHSIF